MFVKHGYGVGLNSGNQVVISTAITVFDEGGLEIGFIQSLGRTDNRPVTALYHLNGADAGRIIEQVPGIGTYATVATSFGLWHLSDVDRRSLINRLPGNAAAAFVVLNQQQVPFAIRQVEEHPSTGAQNVTLFLGCMLTSFSRPVAIGTATVSESCNIAVSWME